MFQRAQVKEQLADNEVLSFDEALPEEEEGSYEADEKPERGRPRRQVQISRKLSDFVMNSSKNRQIRTMRMEGITHPRPEAMLRNESTSVNKDITAKSVLIRGMRMEADELE